MARIGKIARLPCALRETLNLRLLDGEPGLDLVSWLNEVPEVQAVLAAGFAGQPISAQNLTNWRQGGYAEWYRERMVREVRARIETAAADQGKSGYFKVNQGMVRRG